MLLNTHLRYCALVITKILEVSNLILILDKNRTLFVIAHCAFYSKKKGVEFKVLDWTKTQAMLFRPIVTPSRAPIIVMKYKTLRLNFGIKL